MSPRWELRDFDKALEIVYSRSPIDYPWGYMMGEGRRLWFGSQREMARFFVMFQFNEIDFPYEQIDAPDKDKYTDPAIIDRAIDLLDELIDGKRTVASMIEEMNHLLEGEHMASMPEGDTLVWWGTFEELCSSKSQGCLRADFRDDYFRDLETTERPVSGRPIAFGEREALAEWLTDLGD